MKKIILGFAVVLICLSTSAQQDRHFSMAFASPVLKNPGAAGHGLGSLQAFTSYRTQWWTASATPFRTISGSIDAKILQNSLSSGFMGVGVNFINDVSGDGKYSLNIIQVPINYTLQIGKDHLLGLGLQPGMYMQSINEGALYFENQWTNQGFNQGMSSGENLGAFNVSKFDLGAGVFYNAFLKDNFNLQAGISSLHLTAQQVSFYNVAEKLYRNFSFYSTAHIWPNNTNISYHPAIWGQIQGPNFEIIAGCNFEYAIKSVSRHTGYFDGMAISIGTYYRVNDAFIANILYKAGPLTAGVSYDANISRLTQATNSVGAVEVFLKFNPTFEQKYSAPRIN